MLTLPTGSFRGFDPSGAQSNRADAFTHIELYPSAGGCVRGTPVSLPFNNNGQSMSGAFIMQSG